jgi:hypothetical protein
MGNVPADRPPVKGTEAYVGWLACVREEGEQERQQNNARDQKDIFRLECWSTADLQDRAQAIWEDYRVKHLVLRGGDDALIRALESNSPDHLWAQLATDGIELARVFAVLWQRGESWAPKEPVVEPGAR